MHACTYIHSKTISIDYPIVRTTPNRIRNMLILTKSHTPKATHKTNKTKKKVKRGITTFFLTRWPPDGIAGRFRNERGHGNGTDYHQRAKDERRSRHKLGVLVLDDVMAGAQPAVQCFVPHKLGVQGAYTTADGRVSQAAAAAVVFVIKVHVEHVENDAKHGRTKAVAQASHARHHALDNS